MSHTVLDPAGPWVFGELAARADLPDDGRRYEVVDGHLVVTPPPSPAHQAVSNRLHRQVQEVCPEEWEAFVEYPLPMGTDGRVPDFSVVRRRPIGPLGSPAADFGLVVEITSPSSRKTDLFAKPGEYAEVGIPLFWRVDLEPELVVHAYRLEAGSYVDAAVVRGGGGRCPVPWGEMTVDLARVVSG